jgi:hypothetical protein
LADEVRTGQPERVGRTATSALSVLVALTVVVSCSSSDSPTESERVKAALDGLTRGARLPQQPVDNTGRSAGSVHTITIPNNLVGVKHLRQLKNRRCGGGGMLDVYTVTGAAEVLWRRMLRSDDGEMTMAQTEAAGRRIRFLRQSGFDYDIEAALSQGSELGTLLAVRTCS